MANRNRNRNNRGGGNKNINFSQFLGSGAQPGMLGGYAIQQALASGLTRKQIRDAAAKQGLQINPRGYELLGASRQTGKGIQLSQFQGADAQSNILGGYAVRQALSRGLSKKQIRDLAKAQNYTFNAGGTAALGEGGGGIKQAVRTAGQDLVISKQEMKDIIDKSGGNVAKALNKISKVQAALRKEEGVRPPSLAAGATNMLIRQAARQPQIRYGDKSILGQSKLAQAIQSMVGSPGSPGRYFQGQLVGQQPAIPTQFVRPGDVLRASGRVGGRPVGSNMMPTQNIIPTIPEPPGPPGPPGPEPPGPPGPDPDPDPNPDPDPGPTLEDIIAEIFGGMLDTPTYQDYGDLGGGGTQYNMGGGFDMTPLTDMFASQPVLQSDAAMEQALQEMDITDPIQLAALGKAYASSIKGSPRATKSRSMYRRNDMAIQPTPTARKIVGGLTL